MGPQHFLWLRNSHSLGWEADPRPGAQDLCGPGLIILAAIFRPLSLGFQKHFKSRQFSLGGTCQLSLVCCTKLHHHKYLSDKVMSH